MANDHEIRRCNVCKKPMKEGYCIDGGCEYYCSDECLYKKYTKKQWEEMYSDDGDSYYTEWEDEIGCCDCTIHTGKDGKPVSTYCSYHKERK